MRLRDGEHQFAHSLRRQRIGGDSSGFCIDRTAGLQRSRKSGGGLRFHAHDLDSGAIPGGNAADETPAPHRYEQGVEFRILILEFQADGSLAEQRFHLIVGMDHECPGLRCPLFASCQCVGITFAGNYQVRTVATDSLQLGRGRDLRNEDSRRTFQLHGGKGDRGAVISARRGNDAGRRNLPHQHVGKGAPSLEGTGMLHQLQLVDQANAVQSKVRALDFNHRGLPNMRTDQFVSAGNTLAVNLGLRHGSYDNAGSGVGCRGCPGVKFYPGPADKIGVTTPGVAKTVPAPSARFVARQPILTQDEKVFGYELLFRDGVESYFCSNDPEAASRSTLDTSLLMGLDVLCDGRRAFINCTRDMLLKDYITLLPSSQAVVEILESVEPDDLVMAACQRLKEAGYMIALDDFVVDDPRDSLTDFADILKVDVRTTTAEQRAAMVKRYGPWRCRMLAEKVETREEFLAAKKAGFLYFQGYFFRRPETMRAHNISGNQLNYVRMLQVVSKPELEPREIENAIKGEASLCYRLLRYMNSAAFGFANEIHSVRHALSILGEREVRRWVRLVVTLSAGQNKSSELVLSALVRARFCELLSPKIQHGDSDLFLLGLFSMMDSILEISMAEVLENVPIDQETKGVLLGGGSRLRPLYQLMLAQESGDWQRAVELGTSLDLRESDVAEIYWQAMQWARQVSGG